MQRHFTTRPAARKSTGELFGGFWGGGGGHAELDCIDFTSLFGDQCFKHGHGARSHRELLNNKVRVGSEQDRRLRSDITGAPPKGLIRM